MAGVTRKLNEHYIRSQGFDSIHNEVFEFNVDSEDEEDEVFVGDVGFKEKCRSAVVNDLCSVNTLQELTAEQWVHMKEQVDLICFHLWESKQKNFSGTPTKTASLKKGHNVNQSSLITSKRKMQLISGSPSKCYPLQDITNRESMKASPGMFTPHTIQKLSSKLNVSIDPISYDQLGLINPMQLNFDDVEHSPKKSQCLQPYFTGLDSPLITDTENDVLLLSSPDLNQVTAMRQSLGLSNQMSLDAMMKSRVRTKTYKLEEGESILPSLLRPNFSTSSAKESKTYYKNNKAINSEAELKPPRKSLLNVSFTIDKDSETLLGMVSPIKSSENVKSSKEPTLNESFTINKSYICDSAGGKPALNESFTINKSIVRVSLNRASINPMNGKGALNQSSTINTSVKQESVNEKTILSESFILDKSHLDGSVIENEESFIIEEFLSVKEAKQKLILNESFTINESQNKEAITTKKPILNESFTINESQNKAAITTKKPILNESFTLEVSQTVDVSDKKPVLNESFTMNESQDKAVTTKKPILNESFTMNESQDKAVTTKKPILNESFTMNESQDKAVTTKKPNLNESFTINESQNKAAITTKKPVLNESFTMNESQDKAVTTKKPILNESFTMNESQDKAVTTKKPILNESFTLEVSQTVDVSDKKPVLNESFTLEKSPLNPSFTTDAHSLLCKTSTPISGTTLKKKSLQTENSNSLNSSFLNKSTISCKKDSCSRKRSLTTMIKTPTRQASMIKTPPRQAFEPRIKPTVASRSMLYKSPMPTIKSSIIPKVSFSGFQPAKTKFTLKKPNLDFDVSTSTLQKDDHGMVKFQEKSVVPVKKSKSSLLMPPKLSRKSLKISPQKTFHKKVEEPKVQSPVMVSKRKCMVSTPPISRISYTKPTISNINANTDVPKTRLVLPSKLSSNIPKSDTIRQLQPPKIQSKGPLKAFSTLAGKVSEIKQFEGSNSHFAGKSKLRMPSPLKVRPSQIKKP